jgi:hypothetical protein
MYLNSPDKLFIADSEISYYKLSKTSHIHETLNVNSNIINQKFEIDHNQGYYPKNPIEHIEINRNPMGLISSVDEERSGYTFKRRDNFSPVQIHYKHGLIHCDDDRPAINGKASLSRIASDDSGYNSTVQKIGNTNETLNSVSLLNTGYICVNHPVYGKCRFYHNAITYYSLDMKAYFKNGMIHRDFEDGPALIIDSISVYTNKGFSDVENTELKLYAQNGVIIVDGTGNLQDPEAAKQKWNELLEEENKFILDKIERFNYNAEYIEKCNHIQESLPEELSFIQYSS